MELTHELHDWFKNNNGKKSVCCRILTREFDMGKGEHKEQCIRYTGLCAGKVADIIVRECGLTNTDPEPFAA
jgi:putative oxidoreductase